MFDWIKFSACHFEEILNNNKDESADKTHSHCLDTFNGSHLSQYDDDTQLIIKSVQLPK